MPLKPHLRIRRSAEAIWIEDAAGSRCCYTYYESDPGRRALMKRWSYEDAVAIVKTAARALSGQRLEVDPREEG
jgi:hypothetical protein